MTNNELSNINTNVTCKTGYKRINYNCVEEEVTKKSFMYYSGCLNSPNMIMEMNMKSYFISIWIKFDKPNEFCSSTKTKRLYFFAFPHIISSETRNNEFLNNQDTNYHYENILTGNIINITNLVNFNWNLITFHYHEKTKNFKLIINNDTEKPVFTSDKAITNSYELKKIVFCADIQNCKIGLDIYHLNNNYIWGSAYYKNLKVHDGIVSNYINFQEKEQYLNEFNVIPELFNLDYNIPFNTFNTDGGNIQEISQSKKIIDIKSNSLYKTSEYYGQIDEFFHYSSKLSAFDPTDKNYFSVRDINGGKYFFNKLKIILNEISFE